MENYFLEKIGEHSSKQKLIIGFEIEVLNKYYNILIKKNNSLIVRLVSVLALVWLTLYRRVLYLIIVSAWRLITPEANLRLVYIIDH